MGIVFAILILLINPAMAEEPAVATVEQSTVAITSVAQANAVLENSFSTPADVEAAIAYLAEHQPTPLPVYTNLADVREALRQPENKWTYCNQQMLQATALGFKPQQQAEAAERYDEARSCQYDTLDRRQNLRDQQTELRQQRREDWKRRQIWLPGWEPQVDELSTIGDVGGSPG